MAVVEEAREALGPFGAFLPIPFAGGVDVGAQRRGAIRLERAGYRAAWTNEMIGKDAFAQLSVLLAATERLAFGTSIANVWARPPQTAHGAAAVLAEAYPGRFVLGLGTGYPYQAESVGREYGKPLATTRDYLAQMDAPTYPPAPDAPYARIIAANGPKMLALARDCADGALPAMMPPAYTEQARRTLGPDRLLVVALSVATDREHARKTLSERLERPSYATGLGRLGYSTGELAEPDGRLLDDVFAHGGPAAVVAKAREHLAAGADHVVLLLGDGEFEAGVRRLEEIVQVV